MGIVAKIKSLLAEPLTRGMDIDDPRTTGRRREILKAKKPIRQIYDEWYAAIASNIPDGNEPVLELGSGAGFFDEYVPKLITSEIFPCGNIRVILDGQQLPLADGSLRAIVMTDVFHHLPQARKFLVEAVRTIRPGGAIVMIEPWATVWSKIIYTKLHHEPFRVDADAWEFPATGPLSGANGALPWIVFQRDRAIFEKEFPQFRIEKIEPRLPLRYLVAGGISLRSLLPGATFGAVRWTENRLARWNDKLAMFALIVLRRQP